jgi:hypothetical protein
MQIRFVVVVEAFVDVSPTPPLLASFMSLLSTIFQLSTRMPCL